MDARAAAIPAMQESSVASPLPAFWHVQIEGVQGGEAPPERARMAFAHYFCPADHARPPVCGPTRLRWGCAGWCVGASAGEQTRRALRSPKKRVKS
jgi:hypothetical protein